MQDKAAATLTQRAASKKGKLKAKCQHLSLERSRSNFYQHEVEAAEAKIRFLEVFHSTNMITVMSVKGRMATIQNTI